MSYSSSSSPEQSGSSVKRPDQKTLKYRIEREIREQADEESSDESLTERIKMNRAKFQWELRQIKESVLNDSPNFQSSAKKIPSSVYESAKSGTLDLSQSMLPKGKKDDNYETRIKRLESELQNSVKSRTSQSSSGAGSVVSRKLHFDTAAKYEKLDEEANSINENIERLKKQLSEDKSVDSRKKHQKNGIMKTNDFTDEENKFQQLEHTLLNEIQRLRQDNEEIKQMIAGRSSMEMTASYLTQKSNDIKPQGKSQQSYQQPSQRLKELVNKDLTKLDVEMRLLEQVNRVQSKLQRSIQRKLSRERQSPQSSKNINNSISFSKPSPPSRQKPTNRSDKG